MNDAKFESVIILSMEKPENKSLRGVVISGILQFASDISEESYLSEWSKITNDSNILGQWKIKDSELQSESQFEFMQNGIHSCFFCQREKKFVKLYVYRRKYKLH